MNAAAILADHPRLTDVIWLLLRAIRLSVITYVLLRCRPTSTSATAPTATSSTSPTSRRRPPSACSIRRRARCWSEIDTAGCVLVIPSGPNRVSSICESGRLLTVTLDAEGHESLARHVRAVLRCRQGPGLRAGRADRRTAIAFLSFLGRGARSGFLRRAAGVRAPLVARDRGRQRALAAGRQRRWARSTAGWAACTCPCTRAARARTRTAAPRSGCST